MVAWPCMPHLLAWQLPVRPHTVHHGVVLQGRALLHRKRVVPIHPLQPRYGLAIPDESMRARSYPL